MSSHARIKRYFPGLKFWYGSRKRPSFGYKILKNRRFPSLSDFRHGGGFKGNWTINRLFLGGFWKARAVFIGIECEYTQIPAKMRLISFAQQVLDWKATEDRQKCKLKS